MKMGKTLFYCLYGGGGGLAFEGKKPKVEHFQLGQFIILADPQFFSAQIVLLFFFVFSFNDKIIISIR